MPDALHALGPIRDQRTMVAVMHPLQAHGSVVEVAAAWEAWAGENGLPLRRRVGDYSTDLRVSRKTVVAYISGGRWIADCPTCGGGVPAWIENPRGCCLDCGTIYKVDMPPREEAIRAVELLNERAADTDRHWHRNNGETIESLAAENGLLAEAGEIRPTGVVSADEISKVLGPDAIAKLREVGAI